MTHFGCLISKDSFRLLYDSRPVYMWVVNNCNRYICDMFNGFAESMNLEDINDDIGEIRDRLRDNCLHNDCYDDASRDLTISYLEWFKTYGVDFLIHRGSEDEEEYRDLYSKMTRIINMYVEDMSDCELGLGTSAAGIVVYINNATIDTNRVCPVEEMKRFLATYGTDGNPKMRERLECLHLGDDIRIPLPMYHTMI